MSSREAIKAAKTQYELHCARHKCKAGQCEDRKRLWLATMEVAQQWGRDDSAADA